MNLKLLIPAILFMILSMLITIGNTMYALQGKYGIWSFPFWASAIIHGVTMVVGLYLLSGVLMKKEK